MNTNANLPYTGPIEAGMRFRHAPTGLIAVVTQVEESTDLTARTGLTCGRAIWRKVEDFEMEPGWSTETTFRNTHVAV